MGLFSEQLIDKGVLGIMIIYFIWDKSFIQKKVIKAIENNTIALTIFSDRYIAKK